ncbi:O-antigen export system ATP-binding protein [Sodalis praecaptivus]|uniref:O-antigen export system ATP-binding protein n=1 Tax=Sodalis praecaptivus TaxID=1239307 RepID=W0HXN0_9GAMM|nr:ABC transporter ATP-binding protein [Sodalis praecaptivus]AHF78509.1 O-antigen export system ATP-binding protein [Sodalis praecaptivus]
MQAIIKVEKLSVEFPIYTASQRSLKKLLFRRAVGGNLAKHHQALAVKALDNVSFEVHQGERVALLGGNGAGKTTLLRVLAGVYHPTGGRLSIRGEVVSLIDMAMGMESEATGYQNIFIRGLLLGLTMKQIARQVPFIIEFSELGEYISLPVRTYSSGMLLRLAFAIISVLQPSVLLMDEWLTVGDSQFREKMSKKLQQMVDRSAVMILASHSRETIKAFCNTFFLMQNGSLRQISRREIDDYI